MGISETKDYIQILKTKYEELIRDQSILNALMNCGVDNWEGYPEAVAGICNDETYEEIYGPD